MLPESVSLIVHDGKGPLNRDELVLDESMNALEYTMHSELFEYIKKTKKQSDSLDPEVTRNIAELQCALAIIQGANTKEEKLKIFEILKCLGK